MSFPTRFAALLAATLLLGACAEDGNVRAEDPAGSPTDSPASATSAPSESEDSSTPSETPSRAGDPGASDTTDPSDTASDAVQAATVPVYFVGRTPQGTRLYREFRRVDGAAPALAAANLMASGDALDPDYDTLYPDGSFADVQVRSGSIVASLADDTWTTRPAGMSRSDARLAVQQLVYTLQGVAQQRSRVRVELSGHAVRLFGLAGPFRNAPELDVRALVNITTPAEGDHVSRSFVASGVASSFEATVPWEVRKGDRVVRKGFTTAEGWMDKLYPWRATVRVAGLAPGRYTFVAMTDDPSGGEGGGPTEDTRTITVR